MKTFSNVTKSQWSLVFRMALEVELATFFNYSSFIHTIDVKFKICFKKYKNKYFYNYIPAQDRVLQACKSHLYIPFQ